MKIQDLVDKFTDIEEILRFVDGKSVSDDELLNRARLICDTVKIDWKIEQRQSNDLGTQLSKMADKIEFLHQDVEWLRTQAGNMKAGNEWVTKSE